MHDVFVCMVLHDVVQMHCYFMTKLLVHILPRSVANEIAHCLPCHCQRDFQHIFNRSSSQTQASVLCVACPSWCEGALHQIILLGLHATIQHWSRVHHVRATCAHAQHFEASCHMKIDTKSWHRPLTSDANKSQ